MAKHTYKEKLPSIDKLAYICGLIATDGCLHDFKSGLPSKSITLALNDEDTVKFVMKSVCTKRSLVKFQPKNENWGKRFIFSAVLPDLYDYLVQMNITPRKTHTLNPKLDDKSDEFKWYFLRGVIDGDGCVRLNSTLGTSSINIVSSSESFLITLHEIFGGSLNKSINNRNGKYLFSIDWRGSNARQLLSKLPLDKFCMNRKTAKMLSILQFKPYNRKTSPLNGTIWTEEDTKSELTHTMRYDNHSNPAIDKRTFVCRMRSGNWSEYAALNTPSAPYGHQPGFTKKELKIYQMRESD